MTYARMVTETCEQRRIPPPLIQTLGARERAARNASESLSFVNFSRGYRIVHTEEITIIATNG